jgi:cobalt-zinc-cadmium efflux system protein
VAAIGLVVNVAGVVILRRGSAGSLNMKGAYFEVLSDALTSVGVIAAGVVMLTTGWYYADPILSAAIGLFILPRTWKLLSEAVGILLEGTPSNVNLAALRESLLGLPGVSDVHDLHVWTLTSGVNAMSAHIVKSGEATEADLVPNVCGHVIKTFKIAHCTIQAETDKCGEWESHL